MRSKQPTQGTFEFRTWGGARRGAGRPPSGERPGTPHVRREEHKGRHPLHVTMRLAHGLASLRAPRAQEEMRIVLRAASDRHGLRIVHYSAQSNHLHLLCEAKDERSLAVGMRALGIRLARALNALWRRRGKVFGDRYHARALSTPSEVRNALHYVFGNARHHGVALPSAFDPCSSAGSFDGWRERVDRTQPVPWLATADTWLLAKGWRMHGLLSLAGSPGKRASAVSIRPTPRGPEARLERGARPHASGAKDLAARGPATGELPFETEDASILSSARQVDWTDPS